MNDDEIKALLQTIVREELEKCNAVAKQIILFGSRARGSSNIMSDWDFMVVYDGELSRRQILDIKYWTSRKMAAQGIDADIILLANEAFNSFQYDVGNITHYVVKEGSPL